MSRSVSYPSYTLALTFATPFSDGGEGWEWSDFTDNLKAEIRSRIPGLSDIDHWVDREDHAILCNERLFIGVSEYCGLVSVWAVRRHDIVDEDEPSELGDAFTEVILQETLEQAVAEVTGRVLRKVGSFSNGEGVYEEVKRGKEERKSSKRVRSNSPRRGAAAGQ